MRRWGSTDLAMDAVRQLRWAGIVEGISYLVLLFIAMPLKYGLGLPQAVKVVGMAHGVLFVAFVVLLARAHAERDWGWRTSLLLFVSSLLPFGFFAVEGRLKRELAADPPTLRASE